MTTGQDATAQIMLGTQYTHTVTVESAHDPEVKGAVTFRLLTVKEQMQAGVKQVAYRGGVSPDMVDWWTNQMARITAELELAVIDAPAWWYTHETKHGQPVRTPAPANLRDVQVLITIWEAYVAFRDTFPDGRAGDGSRGTIQEPAAVDGRQNSGAGSV